MNKKTKKLLEELSSNLDWLANEVLTVLATHNQDNIQSLADRIEQCCEDIKRI
jgi:ABC-type sulfate/molybdate transport systems ATPase subunit